jgi:hypothetical protein
LKKAQWHKKRLTRVDLDLGSIRLGLHLGNGVDGGNAHNLWNRNALCAQKTVSERLGIALESGISNKSSVTRRKDMSGSGDLVEAGLSHEGELSIHHRLGSSLGKHLRATCHHLLLVDDPGVVPVAGRRTRVQVRRLNGNHNRGSLGRPVENLDANVLQCPRMGYKVEGGKSWRRVWTLGHTLCKSGKEIGVGGKRRQHKSGSRRSAIADVWKLVGES